MKPLRKTDGQAMIEFALIFPWQLIIVMFIVEMSLILVGRSVVGYAAYCAAHAEVLGQDPREAASIALIPLGESASPFAMAQGETDSLPGWGYQSKWADVRAKLQVYRLYSDKSRVLNRVNIRQDIDEYHRTRFVSQHNIGVEVVFPLKLMLPLSFFEALASENFGSGFNDMEGRAFVNVNGDTYFILRERCLLPSRDRLINTTLELKQDE